MKIILTGYRATGKSCIGKELAKRLELSFVDMDKVIEDRFGKISDIVADQGWDFFRARERELLDELAAECDIVIATGGGAIMHQPQWQHLKDSGFCVWLRADIETICQRLAADKLSASQRPSLTGADIKAEVTKVLDQRLPLYKAGSHISIDSKAAINKIVDEIADAYSDLTDKGQ